jgi:hypothetical protein
MANFARKFFKWMGFVVAGLVGLALLGFAYIYFASEREVGRDFTSAHVASLVIPTGAVEIAAGERRPEEIAAVHAFLQAL